MVMTIFVRNQKITEKEIRMSDNDPPPRRNPNMARDVKGNKHPGWKGGVTEERGYRLRRQPEHPRAKANGYVLDHILVLEKKLGRSLLPGMVSHHKDNNKQNNHPDNLEEKLKGEHHSLHNRGEGNPSAKLSEKEVVAIRSLLGTKTQKEIASEYGVHPSLIYLIKTRRKWNHIP